MYTPIAFFGMLKLVTVFHLVTMPEYAAAFGEGPLRAQVKLLLGTFRDDWSMGLILFGIHLPLLGILDLAIWVYSEASRDSVGHRWAGLDGRQFAALPLPEC
jgi:hypothetical protein